jgi:hypothetical protein
MPTNWPPSFLGLDTNVAVPSNDSRASNDAIQLPRKRRSADQALNLGLDANVAVPSNDSRASNDAIQLPRKRRSADQALNLGPDTNVAVPSNDSRASYDAIQLARKRRSADQAVNLGLDTSAVQCESDEKHSQLQRVSKLWGALRQRRSRCVSTGGSLGRKNARRYVVATLLVLLLGAGATVWSKVFKTARQIYMANLSPKEQLAQTSPATTNAETIPRRNQAPVSNHTPKPAEQLQNPQATAGQAGGASQGGILERLLAFRMSESPRVQGDPHARVWVDTHTGVYLCQGTKGFGRTGQGRYMTQQQARFDGFRPAYEKKCE